MRSQKRKGILCQDYINRLNKLEDWYWEKKDKFPRYKYEKIVEWVNENNRLPLENYRDGEEKSLYNWCQYIRLKKRKGVLCQDHIDKINKINGWYWSIKQKNIQDQ